MLFLPVLAHRQHIPIRILEPRHLIPTRRHPNPAFLVRNPRIFFRLHALPRQPYHHRLHVADFPPQHRALQRRKRCGLHDSNQVFPRPHHQRKLIQVHIFKSQLPLIKLARPLIIIRQQKPHHLSRRQHRPPLSSNLFRFSVPSVSSVVKSCLCFFFFITSLLLPAISFKLYLCSTLIVSCSSLPPRFSSPSPPAQAFSTSSPAPWPEDAAKAFSPPSAPSSADSSTSSPPLSESPQFSPLPPSLFTPSNTPAPPTSSSSA